MPRVFLPAVASGALLWAAFFPLDLGPVGFVALVPWLMLVRAPVSNRRRYFAAYVGGFTFFALATQWIRVAHPMMYLSWAGLAAVMPLFWLAALAVVRQLDRFGVPLAVAAPVGWVALEYARMHFPTGFPFLKPVGAYQMIGFGWYFLGYTQHAVPQLIQIADLGGVYAVSFVVASVNGALAGAAVRATAVRRALNWAPDGEPCCSRNVALGGGFATALLAATVGYGVYQLDHPAFGTGPVVSAVQGNVGQDEKMGSPLRLLQAYYDLHARAFREAHPDLIVWPETCQPIPWYETRPDVPGPPGVDFQTGLAIAREELLGRGWGAPVLFGLTGHEWDGEREWKYNSALLLKPRPNPDRALSKPDDRVLEYSVAGGRYDKMHLIPFGEYVPLVEQLPFLRWFTPYKGDYSCRPGENWTRFRLAARDGREFTFGCLICYEDSDPYLARQYAATDPVNFLVNISNDGWFDGTEEHEQHLAIGRFRAVEARRAVVRSVNMGISAVIDADGRVVALPDPDWSKSKKTDAIVTAAVPIDTRIPLYATLGDWIPGGCWIAAGLALAVGFARRKAVG